MQRSISNASTASSESTQSTTPLTLVPTEVRVVKDVEAEPCKNNNGAILSAIKCVLAIVSVSEVVLLVLVVYLFTENVETNAELYRLKSSVKGKDASVQTGKGFCFSCGLLDDVYLEGGIRISDYFEIEEKRQKCCIEDLYSFMKVITTVAQRRLNEELIRGNPCNKESVSRSDSATGNCTRVRKPSAHLVRGGDQILKHDGPEGQQLPAWFDDRDGGFRQGFSHEDGRLIVLETGNYFVYSQVYFVETYIGSASPHNPIGVNPNRPKRVWQAIYKYSEEYPDYGEPVLKTTQSKCWSNKKDFGLHSSYLGAVLSLRAGDKLAVQVSNLSLVPSDTSSTFFGAYMI